MKTLLTAVFVTAAILPTLHPTATAEPTSTSDLPGSAGARELPPVFRGEIVRLDRNLRQRMTGSSWHPGCPVPLRDLRLLKLRVRNFENEVKRGRLVVHKTAASRMVNVFRRLFEAGFRIRRMQLVDAFGADDHRSMNADNTSAFNCREVAGRPGVWSRHAFGRAIDVNPVENPYVFGSHVSPPKGRPFAVRSPRRRGMVNEGGQVVRILASIGWEWGGNWYGAKDYQHFSASGD